jgi:hypothetical protein
LSGGAPKNSPDKGSLLVKVLLPHHVGIIVPNKEMNSLVCCCIFAVFASGFDEPTHSFSNGTLVVVIDTFLCV